MIEKFTKKEVLGIAAWLIVFFSVLIWSGTNPVDRFTWFLEVLPALIILLVLTLIYKRFKFTPLVYWLILLHCIILMVGGKYTYGGVPLFDWIRDFFGGTRNNYDKIGHFMQGFVPALVTREVLIKWDIFKKKKWIPFMVISICLALSAVYEFIEWWVALLVGSAGDAFLGTQGYVWDTQSDMFLCLIGAISSLILLSKLHNKQIDNSKDK